ncbi:MAG: magnesium transporter CorA family protein [Legionellales bacterium]|nr:magnesium transporter CorA family protein [Legionellales bacterium]
MIDESEAWSIGSQMTCLPLSDYKGMNEDGFTWITIPREQLADKLPMLQSLTQNVINEQHIKDALNSEHPSFFDSTEEYQMIVFRSVATGQFDMKIPKVSLNPTSIVSFCFETVLLTVYDSHDPVVDKVKDFIKRNGSRLVILNPADLLYKILHTVTEQTLLLRNPLTVQINEWQHLMLEQATQFTAWNEFMLFKSTMDQLTVWCEEQEDVIEDWQQYAHHTPQQQLTINLNDLGDHIERCIRFTQKLASNLDTLIQLHYSVLSHRNNEVLRVLAIISCVFLPLTLITGIFGMNFVNMPILHRTDAYYYTIGIMICLSFSMLMVFRWRKWL